MKTPMKAALLATVVASLASCGSAFALNGTNGIWSNGTSLNMAGTNGVWHNGTSLNLPGVNDTGNSPAVVDLNSLRLVRAGIRR